MDLAQQVYIMKEIKKIYSTKNYKIFLQKLILYASND